MHAPELIDIEYQAFGPSLLTAGEVPATLKALMKFVADEYFPELDAHVQFTDDWLASNKKLQTGTNGLDRPEVRIIGQAEFEWRGIMLKLRLCLIVFIHRNDYSKASRMPVSKKSNRLRHCLKKLVWYERWHQYNNT
jgi:hypothetical protein